MKQYIVTFSATIDNPKYRYGDLNKPASLTVTGRGEIAWVENAGPYLVVLNYSDGKFYRTHRDLIQLDLGF